MANDRYSLLGLPWYVWRGGGRTMSKIAFSMRDQMDSMSDDEFEDAMSLSKADFLDYLDKAAAGEERCQANVGEPAPDFLAHILNEQGNVSS